MSRNGRSVNHRYRLGIDCVLAIIFLFLSFRLGLDVHWGGNEWKQGDWLINSQSVAVRRSVTGDIVLVLSDLLNLNPVLVVVALQVILLAVVLLLLRASLQRVDPKVAILLAFSPAMFTVFWVADPQGSLRKEILVFIGLLIAALGVTRRRDLFFACGSLIVALSVFAHEAMVLFVPLLAALFLLSLPHKEGRTLRLYAFFGAVCISGSAVLYTLTHMSVADVTPICVALLDRGADEKICTGAIAWLARDLGFAYDRLVGYVTVHDTAMFVLAYALALAPLLYVISVMSHQRRLLVLLVLTAIPFSPLFLVAVDWGRWVSYHVFSITLLIVVMMQTGQVRLVNKPTPSMVLMLVLVALLVSPLHTIGMDDRGAIGEIIKTIKWLAQS